MQSPERKARGLRIRSLLVRGSPRHEVQEAIGPLACIPVGTPQAEERSAARGRQEGAQAGQRDLQDSEGEYLDRSGEGTGLDWHVMARAWRSVA